MLITLLAEATPLTQHNLFNTVEGWVALGTALLAVVTGTLAFATWRMARQTRALAGSTEQEVEAVARQLELSQESLAATREQVEVARIESELSRTSVESAIRPVLVDPPRPLNPALVRGGIQQELDEVGWPTVQETRRMPMAEAFLWENSESVFVSVPLRNIGPGAAFIRGLDLSLGVPLPVNGVPTVAVVPPGERTRIQFVISRSEGLAVARFNERASFDFQVSYTDVAGGQWTLTRAVVGHDLGRDRWCLAQVFIHHKVEDREDGSVDWGEPVAGSTSSWGL